VSPAAWVQNTPASRGRDTGDRAPRRIDAEALQEFDRSARRGALGAEEGQDQPHISIQLRAQSDRIPHGCDLGRPADDHAGCGRRLHQAQAIADGSRRVAGTGHGEKFGARATQSCAIPDGISWILAGVQHAVHSCPFDAIQGQSCQDAPEEPLKRISSSLACPPDFQDLSPVFGDSVVDGGLISWPALGRGRFQPEVRMQRGTDIETKNAISAVARSCDRTDALGEEIDELHTSCGQM